MKQFSVLLALGLAGAALLSAAAPEAPSQVDLLWHHRNLGKAFYENPTTQYQAVTELKAALDLAPDSARERLWAKVTTAHAAWTEHAA